MIPRRLPRNICRCPHRFSECSGQRPRFEIFCLSWLPKGRRRSARFRFYPQRRRSLFPAEPLCRAVPTAFLNSRNVQPNADRNDQKNGKDEKRLAFCIIFKFKTKYRTNLFHTASSVYCTKMSFSDGSQTRMLSKLKFLLCQRGNQPVPAFGGLHLDHGFAVISGLRCLHKIPSDFRGSSPQSVRPDPKRRRFCCGRRNV